VDFHPPGFSVLRKNWEGSKTPCGPCEHLVIDGHTVHVEQNYRCVGSYGPEQKIEFLGVLITVWHKESPIVSANETINDVDRSSIENAIKRCIERVDVSCAHKNSIRTKILGRCLNEYTCPDCGTVYSVDSSD
jgi:hypothetical protein